MFHRLFNKKNSNKSRKQLRSLRLSVEHLEPREMLCTGTVLPEIEYSNGVSKCLKQGQALAIFVDGHGGGGVGRSDMPDVFGLLDERGALIHQANWNDIDEIIDPYFGFDNRAVSEISNVVNAVPQDSDVILVGHSFGADTLLNVVGRVNRRIDVLAVFDPVNWGGQRTGYSLLGRDIDYLYHRWQNNIAWPWNFWDSIGITGVASHTVNDQRDANFAKREDGSKIREGGTTAELLKINRRTNHSNLPRDEFLRRQLRDIFDANINFASPVAQARLDLGIAKTLGGLPLKDQRIFLDASGSYDLDGDQFYAYLDQIDGPATARITPVSEPGKFGFYVEASLSGLYRFRLSVATEASRDNISDFTEITVQYASPPPEAYLATTSTVFVGDATILSIRVWRDGVVWFRRSSRI